MKSKICRVCKKNKPLSDFNNFSKSEDGKATKCRECAKEYRNRPDQKIKTIEHRKKYTQENKETLRAKSHEKYLKKYYGNKTQCLENHKKYVKAKETGKFYTYILPKENYAGQSKNLWRRMIEHRGLGRNTSNWYIHGEYNTRHEALVAEHKLHQQGYTGLSPVELNYLKNK